MKERRITKQEERRMAKYPETSTFHWYNANPRGKISCDCVIRAIATAADKSWTEVFTDLCEISKKTLAMPDERTTYGKYLEQLGFIKQPQPRKWDGTKYTGKEFCEELCSKNDHVFVAHIGSHHIVCIKWFAGAYKVFDHWNSTGGCIGSYWVR